MEARVRKWGNSLGIRIPRSLAEDVGLHEDAVVDLQAKNGRLVIRAKARSYNLEELLARITPENIHSETAWGPRIGKEIW